MVLSKHYPIHDRQIYWVIPATPKRRLCLAETESSSTSRTRVHGTGQRLRIHARVSCRPEPGRSAAQSCVTTQAASSAAPQPAGDSRLEAKQLLKSTWQLLYSNLWLVVGLFLLADVATWLLHRVAHRLTNQLAVQFLAGVPGESIPNMWWLTNNPDIANFETGYQWLAQGVFLLVFPVNLLLTTLARAAAILRCHSEPGPDTPTRLPHVRQLAGEVRGLWQQICPRWLPLWETGLQLAVRAIPLTGLSLLVLPLPWTLPRLMALQASMPVAVLEGQEGTEPLKTSQDRLPPSSWKQVAVPWAAFLAATRGLDFLKILTVGALPTRWQHQVPEIALVLWLAFYVASAVVARGTDLLGLSVHMATSS